MELPILYEDNHIIIVNKPSGIPSQPNAALDSNKIREKSVLEIVQQQLERRDEKLKQFLRLNHRLDKPVSGLVLLSKTSKATSRINQMFTNHLIKKSYLGIVCGVFVATAQCQHFLQTKTPEFHDQYPNYISSKDVETDFKPLKSFTDVSGGDLTLLRIHLHTGRRHQIRSQLQFLGFPLYNDYKYQSPLPIGKSVFPLHSVALHAHQLAFTHPVSNVAVLVQCPVPIYWNYSFPKLNFEDLDLCSEE